MLATSISIVSRGQSYGGYSTGSIVSHTNLYYRTDRIHTPLLIVAGEADTTVPYEESKKFFVGLRRMDRPVQLAIYPGEGHVIATWSKTNAVDVSQRMVDFLDKHLR